jgi:hypothetical protein
VNTDKEVFIMSVRRALQRVADWAADEYFGDERPNNPRPLQESKPAPYDSMYRFLNWSLLIVVLWWCYLVW